MQRMEKTIIFLVVAMIAVLLPLTGFSWPIPDTGQEKCYNNNEKISFPEPGEPFYGQDANYKIHPPSYTKLDENGNALPDSAKSWAMVKDNITGLIWEMKKNDDGVRDYKNPHDADNIYTWYDPSAPVPGTPGDLTDTKDFVDAINAEQFGGYDDWRIPSIDELFSIRYYGDSDTFSDYFPAVESRVWSSTSSVPTVSRAWIIWFEVESARTRPKEWEARATAVRGGNPEAVPALVDNEDGTITDRESGLMWQKDTVSGKYNWQEALRYCENLDLADYTDWRMPSIKELQSLIDYEHSEPAINAAIFPDTVLGRYWSSTTYPGYDTFNNAVSIDFSGGSESTINKGDLAYVRAVRGGKIETTNYESGGDGDGGSSGCFLSSIIH